MTFTFSETSCGQLSPDLLRCEMRCDFGTVFFLVAGMMLPGRPLAEAAESLRPQEKPAMSASERELLKQCSAAMRPGGGRTALPPQMPAKVIAFCQTWKGYSQRAGSNLDLDADYSNALREFYSSRPWEYAECLATASLAPWQKQQIYEAKVHDRENRLYEAIDRRRTLFHDEHPSTEVGKCRRYK